MKKVGQEIITTIKEYYEEKGSRVQFLNRCQVLLNAVLVALEVRPACSMIFETTRAR